MYLPFKPVSYSMSMAHNTNDYNHIDKKSNRLSFFWRLDLRKAGGSFFSAMLITDAARVARANPLSWHEIRTIKFLIQQGLIKSDLVCSLAPCAK